MTQAQDLGGDQRSAPVDVPAAQGPEAKGDGDPDGGGGAKRGAALLTVAALGVVFGDIGTSPLYALHAVFSADGGTVKPNQTNVYGVISLVFWAIMIVVSLKYLTLILRADNDGEGGIMALIGRVSRLDFKKPALTGALVLLGLVGASLFYGDGMITPAISVLSAVEGLKVATPSLEELVVPLTVGILVALFVVQRFGTRAVGHLFGPIMAVWFGTLAAFGTARIAEDPGVLRGLSPSYGLAFLVDHGSIAFVALSGVVLVVTGSEALYADLGHFGRGPIRRAWFFVAFPALTLNYLGQSSLILASPKAVGNPFYQLLPQWARIPMVVLATVATIIASQAVISGAFSATRQAVHLGFLPRLRIYHTSAREIGQVYAPAVNRVLLAAVVGLVVGFGSSESLASAYGIAVTGTFAITTTLFFVVVRKVWHKPLWLVLPGAAAFLVVDLGFFSANAPKLLHGGWFPLAVAAVVFSVLSTWRKGREIVNERRVEEEGRLGDFVEEVRGMDPPLHRPRRTAVFLNAGKETTPLALRANVESNEVLPESVVIVSVSIDRVPHIPPHERLVVDPLGYDDDGIVHVTARFGFQDDPDIPATLRLADSEELECDIDVDGATYFLSKITLVPSRRSHTMNRWRQKLFIALSRTAASPVDYFGLPEERIVTIGGYIEL